MRGKSRLKIFSSACLPSPRRECSTWGNVVIVNALLFSEYLHIWNTLASAHTPTAHTRTIYLTVYECPYFCFFDLLIMIKLLRASWLEMAQRVESWLFRFTASHSGAEKKTTKWRVEEDRTRLKTSTSNRREKKNVWKLPSISRLITLIDTKWDFCQDRWSFRHGRKKKEMKTADKKCRGENCVSKNKENYFGRSATSTSSSGHVDSLWEQLKPQDLHKAFAQHFVWR